MQDDLPDPGAAAGLLAHLKSGDHLIVADDLFIISQILFAEDFPSRGIDVTPVEITNHEAVKAAREAFPRHPEAVDAVLGWLFARFPRFGARGSDMVAHHAMLRDERYYEGWVALCAWLRLFERDR